LGNISHQFKLPNILDIKLGTILYDDTASPEKVARMGDTARKTTSWETGVRLTGFQVYDYDKNEAVNTPKSYGKSIKVSDLPDGFRNFFPLNTSSSTSDKPTGTGLPLPLLLPILEGFKSHITRIRSIVASYEFRMVGGSLLIVYEADWERAEKGIKYQAARGGEWDGDEEISSDEDDDEMEVDQEDGGYEDEDADGELDPAASIPVAGVIGGVEGTLSRSASSSNLISNSSTASGAPTSGSKSKKPKTPKEPPIPAYVVKLIDFAHTKFVPGQGPDEGVLKGFDTTLRLLEGRIAELKAQGEGA
jgi:1D-myo-inositol-tetrakisphosphate 5-kinase/inositol-polyphosphate multikinase